MNVIEYCCDLQIYDLLFRIHSPIPISFPECFRPFIGTGTALDEPDCTIVVRTGTVEDCYVCREDMVQRYHLEGTESITRIESSENAGSFCLFIPERYAEEFSRNANWLLYFALERQIIQYGRIVLHASAVIYRGQAYLFTAPSGGGKSTQAGLWETYCGAEVLNGDKVVLREVGQNLLAYGGPIAGSSNIYINKSAPVAAIFQLEKGTRNCLRALTEREAFLLLYSEAVKSDWDERFNRRLLEIIEKIAVKTKFMHFACLPERTAVDYVRRWMRI